MGASAETSERSTMWTTARNHLLLCCAAMFAPVAAAGQADGVVFAAAAQEVTQLFWLAETANVCGWANADEALRFKQFSMRFFAAHLSETHMRALSSLVTANGYETGVRRAAEESSAQSCDAARWHDGWVAYKAAADQHEQEF